jgi:glycerophosphoryl diester phosphodiesterase
VVNITNCVVTRGGFKGNTSNAVLHTSFSYSQNQDSEEVPTKWNTVPTLQNFLNESKQLNMNLFIEMKNVYNKSLFLEQIKAHLDLYNYYNKTVMISFFPDLLKGVRNQSPQLFSVLLTRPNSAS